MEMPEFADKSKEEVLQWLDSRAVLELTSKITQDELTICAMIALEKGCERLILVSSPAHIMRAHKTAISEFSRNKTLRPLLHGLYAVASDVSYANATVDDVLIVEPPHRPDRLSIPFHKTLKDIFLFNGAPELAEELHERLKATITEFKKRLK